MKTRNNPIQSPLPMHESHCRLVRTRRKTLCQWPPIRTVVVGRTSPVRARTTKMP